MTLNKLNTIFEKQVYLYPGFGMIITQQKCASFQKKNLKRVENFKNKIHENYFVREIDF